MNKPIMLGLMLVGAAALSGCLVSQGKYQAAVAESDAAKADLDKVRLQKNSLELQVRSLKDANNKVVAEAELAQAELARIKEGREKEKEAVESRVREQEQKLKELSTQQKALRQEYEEAKQRNDTLSAAVARYQKELKERQHAGEGAMPKAAPPSAPAMPAVPKAPAPPPVPPKGPAAVPPAAAPAAQSPALAPVNVNKASVNDMVLFLGLTKDVAERIAANRPYKVRGELVAKNVLPKATFDVIKDRISVSP